MTVNGTEIEIFDGFEVEFGESCVFTENHLLRHHKRVKKEKNPSTGGDIVIVKGALLSGIPAKCILEYTKGGQLCTVSFKVKASDYNAPHSPEDACEIARNLAAILVKDLVPVFGNDVPTTQALENYESLEGVFKLSVGVFYNPAPGVKVSISRKE